MDISPLIISLEASLIATVIVFVSGVFTAWAVTIDKKSKVFFDTVFSLPMVLPPTVIGFLLLILFGKNSFVGEFLSRFGINMVFSLNGAVAAAFTVSFPIMYTTARGAFEQVDSIYIDAAKTIGMSRLSIFTRIRLPIAWPGMIAGIVLTFARAMGEFGATIMIAGNLPGRTQTMSVAVYTAMQSGNRELASRWVAVILCISFLSIISVRLWNEYLGRKKK
ncbi:molybdate ABC transporter permease subunit [uncultured Ruminococcus sp.]|uniref:molybdate ABC transporter permease subunit n=1 Tax=uncultured Ruminococcus sp. TaxID=165186 RepID=UPI0025FBD80A|nr:molybdate ABC transporter permease subunit [uncultured Ruminococcus sp.]